LDMFLFDAVFRYEFPSERCSVSCKSVKALPLGKKFSTFQRIAVLNFQVTTSKRTLLDLLLLLFYTFL